MEVAAEEEAAVAIVEMVAAVADESHQATKPKTTLASANESILH